ncbi:MAG: hypothetical protein LBN35_01195, partial [Clostridiales Family XIII bacterium]|nr:hypothetical protein [Clostridiales Family XIII bacterium]
MKSKRKFTNILVIFIAAMMVFVTLSGAPVYAKTDQELKEELKQAKQDVKDAKEDLQKAKDKEADLKKRISSLESTIKDTQSELASLQKEIDANNKQVDKIEARIAVLDEEVGSQQSSLNVRLRNMYLSGDMSIIEVLLGSQNIVDFLTNLDMVKRIHQMDVQTL